MTGDMTVRAALGALDGAGVAWCLRTEDEPIDDPDAGDDDRGAPRDVDVLVRRGDRDSASAVLEQAGFRRLRARGQWGHRFHVARRPGGVVKIDLVWATTYPGRVVPSGGAVGRRERRDGLWVAVAADRLRHAERRAERGRSTRGPLRTLAMLVPPTLHRAGPVVAVLGPDGAGKSTMLHEVPARLPLATRVIYLGLWGGSHARVLSPELNERASGLGLPEWARFLAALGVRWVRGLAAMARARWLARLGVVVLLDRHPVEVRATALDRQTWRRRAKLLLLDRCLPRPDRIVVLTAPGELLHERSGQHDAAFLEEVRGRFADAFAAQARFVDTAGDQEAAIEEVLDEVWQALEERRGWATS